MVLLKGPTGWRFLISVVAMHLVEYYLLYRASTFWLKKCGSI